MVAYFVGVTSGNIPPPPYVPYISELGESRPNASWYALFLTLSAVFLYQFYGRRYAQLEPISVRDGMGGLNRVNQAAYYIGMSGIFGRLGVVAFHHLYADKSLHYTTAFIYFGSALAYDILQTVLTYKTTKRENNVLEKGSPSVIPKEKASPQFESTLSLFLVRLILCMAMGACLMIFFPFVAIDDLDKYNSYNLNIGEGAEWSMAFFHTFFMLTFMVDFWNVSIKHNFIITSKKTKVSESKPGNLSDIHSNNEFCVPRIAIIGFKNDNTVLIGTGKESQKSITENPDKIHNGRFDNTNGFAEEALDENDVIEENESRNIKEGKYGKILSALLQFGFRA
ncbi:DNA damage-regulated autophagy modulator protein 1-like [Clytia hemisphaerica]